VFGRKALDEGVERQLSGGLGLGHPDLLRRALGFRLVASIVAAVLTGGLPNVRHGRMTSHTPMSSQPSCFRQGGARRRNAGEADTEAPCAPSRGRSQTLCHNIFRPHSSLGNVPPAFYADRHAAKPQRGATPRAPRPAPLLHRASWAQMKIGLSSSGDESWGSFRILSERERLRNPVPTWCGKRGMTWLPPSHVESTFRQGSQPVC
jgi:hypothetical protein